MKNQDFWDNIFLYQAGGHSLFSIPALCDDASSPVPVFLNF